MSLKTVLRLSAFSAFSSLAILLCLSVWPGRALSAAAAQNFVQVGADIDGEAGDNRFGDDVALSSDGRRLAVGAPLNDGAGSYAGHVRVFDWIDGAWRQVGDDIEGEAAQDRLGSAIALSADGSVVAAGAVYNDDAGTSAGHVRVYQWSGTTWAQIGADIDGEGASNLSGASVALSSDGSRVAFGAQFKRDAGNDAGHVRVYDWNGVAWAQVGEDIDGEAPEDWSGGSVALSSDGSRVAIAAERNDGAGDKAGHVRVFDLIDGSWQQAGEDIDGEAAGDESGDSLALSSDGNRVAIGAPRNDGVGDKAGHVRVFDWIDGAWTQVGADIDG